MVSSFYNYHYVNGIIYYKLRNFCKDYIFRETLPMQSFVKIKPLQNGKISHDISNCEFLTWQICLNTIRENKILPKIFKFTVVHLPLTPSPR